ncbi:MAG: DUF192 domain-containing protein [Rhodocyclaceae bacterium]|nr:DUF192 domain-containing protein [Rhodocyclaceae bacterium]MBK6906701.1 DUF192 domain-containing protein [Rhodocyclaceae bacterium]
MKSIFNVFVLSVVGCIVIQPAQAQLVFPRVELTIGMYRISAQVAATPQTRERGLMLRETMPINEGMVFVFPRMERHCMWMRNTLLPLAVAFVDERGVIINIEEMQPKTDTTHCARRPAKYALEMNSGWFRKHGFKAGSILSGVDQLDGGH